MIFSIIFLCTTKGKCFSKTFYLWHLQYSNSICYHFREFHLLRFQSLVTRCKITIAIAFWSKEQLIYLCCQCRFKQSTGSWNSIVSPTVQEDTQIRIHTTRISNESNVVGIQELWKLSFVHQMKNITEVVLSLLCKNKAIQGAPIVLYPF